MSSKRALLGDALLLLTAVIWGSAFVVVKNTLDSVGPLYTLALRFSISALGAAALLGRSLRGISRTGLLQSLITGVLLYVAFAFQTVGLKYTTPGKNAFLTTVYVVMVPLACWAWKKRRPSPAHLVAAVLALAGIALISLDGSLRLGLGDGLSILCGLFFAFHIVSIDDAGRTSGAQAVIVIQFLVAAALSWVIAPFAEPSPFPLSGGTWGECFTWGWPVRCWAFRYKPSASCGRLPRMPRCCFRWRRYSDACAAGSFWARPFPHGCCWAAA